MPQSVTNPMALGAGETVWRTFNFGDGMDTANGETLSGPPQVTIVDDAGIDPTPQSRLLSPAQVVGPAVTIQIGTAVAGAVYRITVICPTTGNQTLELWTLQACEAA